MKNCRELEEKIGYHFQDEHYLMTGAHPFLLCQ